MLKCDCTYGLRCVIPPRQDCKACGGSGFVETREEEVARVEAKLERMTAERDECDTMATAFEERAMYAEFERDCYHAELNEALCQLDEMRVERDSVGKGLHDARASLVQIQIVTGGVRPPTLARSELLKLFDCVSDHCRKALERVVVR